MGEIRDSSLIDLGYKDELNLAEFPIAALTRPGSGRSNDTCL